MIIQRYLFREVFQTFLAVLAILVLVYLSHRFVSYLADAAAGAVSSDLIFELLILKGLENVGTLLPLAFYVATLLALGRLYKDSEVVAMIAGGIGLPKLAQAVFWTSIALAAVALVLTLYVAPLVATLQQETLARAREESEITGLYPGRFKVFPSGEQTVYVQQIAPDRRSMHNVFVQTRKRNRDEILVADSAYQRIEGVDARRYIVLENGHRYTGTPGEVDFVITQFETHAILLDRGKPQPEFQKHGTFSTMELIGSDDRALKAELQWRLSLPITLVVLAMLAVPLARTSPRQGKYAKLFTALAIYFAYNNAIGVFQKFVERGDLPPAVGVWPVHGVMALVVGGLLLAQAAPPGHLLGRLRRIRWRNPKV